MRVAVVAGPDPGHAFPAIALCLRLREAGDAPVLFTGEQWLDTARSAGLHAELLAGLDPEGTDDDGDAGAKIHRRAARMAVLNVPGIRATAPDLVVSDVITACGGMAAELLGVPWIELNPHPLYLPSKGLPPLGSGLAPGVGLRGRMRDTVMRALTARSIRAGHRHREQARTAIGLPAREPGPLRRLIATLPALEVPRPDWPAEAVVVGPLHFEPTDAVLEPPPGGGPLVVVAPSTAVTGAAGLAELALTALRPGRELPAGARVAISRLGGPELAMPAWAVAGLGRQDALLAKADVLVCGGGHGIVAKALLHGVPLVTVPGGGDQWEIANRVVRQGSGRLIRPLTPESLSAAVAAVLADHGYRDAAQRAGSGAEAVTDPVRVCHDALAPTR
ncbi:MULTISPECIES: glycosyltransferase [Mycobacteriaceae]|uniref:Glycosyl transferase n=1 Tax=Mycolicibacterium neoaurum VKM Ac-1815D TaxID=700508 RepID=V5XBN2_MYCNE|nr:MULTISPECIES: nucleotide disphospho-sugar-binding domain-containing protein [Mycobacteriaceae]AHC25233.1 glycosyl transferase [Mycolicibacterium neoaurum VKM Ac-1815D]AMO08274.1 glycosyl transferase [Mycolicibacterium neoaurum]AXK78397.1 glycosyl transferase [Mycolicibacterium neoaurum]KJQ49552.1 glycosyl transferase [Mycolicibacterium neoaurum]KUM09194.1 glycosyl transferase [Mycolicibacterium neoaurum]